MITETEQQATLLSATKKDYYQIWNELLESAHKLSEIWDPTSTNESDPGIVLLKELTAVADHLNYNIDKNILEAFMPSAAQEESMRKLCEMMGYAMAYYRSATTDVTIYYSGDSDEWSDADGTGYASAASLTLPMFTQITNTDQDIVYTTMEAATFTAENSMVTVPCIEGTLNYCEEDNDDVVTLDNLDDNNRYYLPASQIAENGVFIYNVSDSTLADKWEQVDNLNTQELESKVYKFGYDSKESLPYIEFPSDISSLIEDGLSIAYISTSGVNGNVSAKTLTTFETPSEWDLDDSSGTNVYNTTGVAHESDDFTCYNASAATNGEDKESLDNAYKNFKKTVGTFDTLVTCRDYMNKIYQLTVSDFDTTPLVSNSVVSDIRDDINRAITICTFDDTGIKYVDKSLTETVSQTVTATSIVIDGEEQSNNSDEKTLTFTSQQDMIDHFDLMLYPFKTVTGLNTKTEYDASFKYAGESAANDVIDGLSDYKTISHAINLPEDDEIMCVKIYMRLNAKISTVNKVNSVEWAVILSNIKTAIYEAFNCRELDFGEEVPFDDILETIQNADTNIKNVSLEDPELYTAFLTADGKEYLFATDDNYVTDDEIVKKRTSDEKSAWSDDVLRAKKEKANELYNKLAMRNVLAGRVGLFNYDADFATTIAETKNDGYELIYPTSADALSITSLEPKLTVTGTGSDGTIQNYTLKEHQIIRFRAPNFKTSVTYPAYVNYFLKRDASLLSAAKAATFETLGAFLSEARTATDGSGKEYSYPAYRYEVFMNYRAARSNNYIEKGTIAPNGTAIGFKQIKLYPVTTIGESGDYYVIPTASNSAVSADDFDGRVYKIESALRCDYNGDYGTAGGYLRVFDEQKDSSAYDGINVSDIEIPARLIELKTGTLFTTASDAATGEPFTYYSAVENPDSASDTYYYYPCDSTTWMLWNRWVKNYTEFEGSTYEQSRKGLYRISSSVTTNVIGELIDTNHSKYALATAWSNFNSSPFANAYVQELHFADADGTIADGEVAKYGSTKDGLGEGAEYSSLSADTEYQLKEGEFLCINYTESTSTIDDESTSDDTSGTTYTTTSEVINEYYGEGTVIKPNFDILDSATEAETASYSKTSGYDFSAELGSDYEETVPGMFSLGSDEQIEIREQVTVYVYDSNNTSASGVNPVYVYFNINGGEEDRLNFLDAARGSKRILEEGEYFWYTDKNKQTLTYCGEGTEIYNYTGQAISKSEDDDVSTEDILADGISVVPWVKLNNLYMADPSSPDESSDRYIQWNEYQYITLVEGDTLSECDLGEINSDWTACDSAVYVSDGTSSSLPSLSVDDAEWEAQALLEVSMNSDSGQTLASDDGYTETITAYNESTDGNGETTTTTIETFENVTLKSNYAISSSSLEIDTTYGLYDEDGILTETVQDFKLKAYDQEELSIAKNTVNEESLTLNNMGGSYTSFSFENLAEDDDKANSYMTFYCVTPNRANDAEKHNFSLLMVYYQTATATAETTDYVHIKVTNLGADGKGDDPFQPAIYNCNRSDGADSWWTDWSSGDAYYLKPGVNVIEFYGEGQTAQNLKIDVYAGSDTSDLLILSPLDTVTETLSGNDTDLGINLTLIGYASDDATQKEKAEDVLSMISELDPDHEFYYNSYTDSSLEIDINEDAGESLSYEPIWFDYNNVNNKFVIAEIDSDYLDTGITLARTSSK